MKCGHVRRISCYQYGLIRNHPHRCVQHNLHSYGGRLHWRPNKQMINHWVYGGDTLSCKVLASSRLPLLMYSVNREVVALNFHKRAILATDMTTIYTHSNLSKNKALLSTQTWTEYNNHLWWLAALCHVILNWTLIIKICDIWMTFIHFRRLGRVINSCQMSNSNVDISKTKRCSILNFKYIPQRLVIQNIIEVMYMNFNLRWKLYCSF